jgi:hypothetical protein
MYGGWVYAAASPIAPLGPHSPALQMMAAAERAGLITPQFMAALAATLGTSHSSTVVVGGGHTILVRAEACADPPKKHNQLRVRPIETALQQPVDPHNTCCLQRLTLRARVFLQEAAKSAGMLALAVPPSVAMRGGFAAADAVFDGYGAGGGLTWYKTKLLLEKRQRQAEGGA